MNFCVLSFLKKILKAVDTTGGDYTVMIPLQYVHVYLQSCYNIHYCASLLIIRDGKTEIELIAWTY